MEKIEFDWSQFENSSDAEKANALMAFILNRAVVFDRDKFDTILIDFVDTPVGHVAWHLAIMMATFKDVKICIRSYSKLPRFYQKMGVVKVVGKRKFEKLKAMPNTLFLDAITTYNSDYAYVNPYPQIFLGIDAQELEFIARNLYGWVDDKKEFKKLHKPMKAKRFKKVKPDA